MLQNGGLRPRGLGRKLLSAAEELLHQLWRSRGVFTFPLLMSGHTLLTAKLGAAIASALGLVATVTMLPETKGRSLEELSAEARPRCASPPPGPDPYRLVR